jgi:hypothetical protein
LGSDDIVIVCGGSNDINKNESNFGLRQLKKLVLATQNTNIFIVTVPHRYDLQAFSFTNKEIEVFNRKVQKIMKLDRNVSVVDTNLSRNEFTQHGRHLNASGREKLAVFIGKHIKTFIANHTDPPIMIKWEESQTDLNHEETRVNSADGKNSVIVNKEVKSSKRQKKNPLNKNKDFFMDDELRDNVTLLENRKNKGKSDGVEQVSLVTSLKIHQQNIRGLRKKSN